MTNNDNSRESVYLDEDVSVDDNNTIQVFDKWEDYNLKTELLRGIYSAGWEAPSFIQKTSIKPILDGRDVRAQAQSGTGKTGAFAVGSLQKVDMSIKKTQILVLVSTREIAEQNATRMEEIGQHLGVKIPYLVGGISTKQSIQDIADYPQIVTGTPGRVFHMIDCGALKTDDIKLLIIDEADEMLKKGFIDQVKEIFMKLPKDKLQVAMYSATWGKEELDIADDILLNPVKIDLRQDKQTLKGIDQYYVNIGEKPSRGEDILKTEVLMDIFSKSEVGQSVIFVNTKSKAKFLYDTLTRNKFPCSVVHSDLNQNERTDVLNKFRRGETRCLVSTGLMGRGIDVQQLSVVFNFDIPSLDDKNSYIHRIGRAGRYGRKGVAVNIIFNNELETVNAIERHFHTAIHPLPKNFNLK
ncbi:Eukaryotic translation initiation factor 4A [Spraguea lophii 42_110]|uniref:RNA helicase n=1 Tax=Spraguea lophii (strain 42_110) TaxID=1358809 RepID=S7XJD3_SPRLO|nr:Eukaryotic translation initiation factor 4A [Spraguea lophii 42_110]